METQLHQLKIDLQDLIGNLVARIDSIVSLLQDQKETEANERLVFLAEDISVVAQSAALLQPSRKGLDLEELNAKLTLLIEQMETGDFLYVADLLSLELKPLFEHWSDLLQDA